MPYIARRRTSSKKTKKQEFNEFLDITNRKTLKQTNLNERLGYINNNSWIKSNYQINKQLGGGSFTPTEKIFGRVYSEVPDQYFNIRTKKEYAQLVRDVRATWIIATIRKKLGIMSVNDYLMFTALMRANLHFARINLFYERLTNISNILFYNNNSLIKKIQQIINNILAIQKDIQEDYGLTVGKKGSKSNKEIKKKIKQQEKERVKLINIFLFKNTNEISDGCHGTLGV